MSPSNDWPSNFLTALRFLLSHFVLYLSACFCRWSRASLTADIMSAVWANPTMGPFGGLMVISALCWRFSTARITLLSNRSPRILRILLRPVSTSLRTGGVITYFLAVYSTFIKQPPPRSEVRGQIAEVKTFKLSAHWVHFCNLTSDLCNYFFTLLWCVLGIFISSLYFATVRRVTWMPCDCRMRVIFSSVNGRLESSSSISFLTRRFKIRSEVPPPSGPCTLSEKKYRNSNTPWGVWTYLLATARLTVEGCTPISSATSLIIIGFN